MPQLSPARQQFLEGVKRDEAFIYNDIRLSPDVLMLIFEKGDPAPGRDPDKWRLDIFGRLMQFSDWGDRDSEYGWERDHIVRVRHGGMDVLSNLRPLHWRSNLERERKPDSRQTG